MSALHARIRAEIETAILSGEWPPGHRVPPESELMARYGCARMTVNKALSGLAEAGLIERNRRAGSKVARPRAQSMVLEVPDLAAEVAARGARYRWELALREIHLASAAEAAELDRAGAVLEIEGLHRADGSPLAWERRLVAVGEAPGIVEADLAETAPGTWLLAHVPWTEAENRITAAAAPARIAAALEIAPGAPCLVVTRRTWRGGATITRVEQWFVGGAYELVAKFGAGASG